MALINPQTSFLDQRLFDNYESLYGSIIQSNIREFTSSNFGQIQRTSTIPQSVPPIDEWRHAEHTDIPQIEKLCTPETKQIYGSYNLVDLVESSLFPIVLINAAEEVVAFMAVQDYPVVPFLPATDWEQWFDGMYQVRIYTALNTRFIHLLVWHHGYEGQFLKEILSPIFAEDSYVEYVLLQLPFKKHIKNPYKGVFYHYLSIMDLDNVKMSVRKIHEFKEKYLLGLYVALRIHVGPNVIIRKAKKEDNNKIIKGLLKQNPKLKLIFDETLLSDLPKQPETKKNKRVILIGEYKDNKNAYGVMTFNKDVDVDLINEYYNTFIYQGFRNHTSIDYPCDPNTKWNKVDVNYPLQQFDRSFNSETTKLPQQEQQQDQYHSLCSFFPYSNKMFTSPEQNKSHNDEVSSLAKGFSVTKMKTDRPFIEEPQKCDIEDNKEFELKRQICLSYANEENISLEQKYALVGDLDFEMPKEQIKKYFDKTRKSEKKINYGKQTTAMEIESYLPPKTQNPKLIHNYLKYIFEHTPKKKKFLLVSVPRHSRYLHFLHYFSQLDQTIRTEENRDLYACNRWALIGNFVVREAEMGDFDEIMALTIHNPHFQSIHQDVFTILRSQNEPTLENSQKKCYVFMCSQLLIGFSVVGPEDEIDYLIGNYNLEDFIYYSLHRRDAHGFVRHFILIPTFLHLVPFFLRSIMRSNFWTSLYTFMIPRHLITKYPQFSILCGIEYWIPIQPRHLPQYWKDGLGTMTPHARIIKENVQPFALYHMNYKMSGVQKKLYTFKIVIVGAGELAKSFLEHLIFSPTCWNIGYRNITLISQGGIQNKFEEKYQNIIKLMLVSSERYYEEYLNKLSLITWVDFVKGMVTSIDRKKQFLMVDETYCIDYDYLFLFCGTQFSKPEPVTPLTTNKECRVVFDEIKGVEQANKNVPINLYTINDDQDAYCALINLKETFDNQHLEADQTIVIYGHCLDALACVAGLLEYGISGSLISLVEPSACPFQNIDYTLNTEIYNSIKSSLELCCVHAYYQYSFSCWETEELVLPNEKKITKVHFQSHNHVISLPAIALISFEPKAINYQTRLALQKACLVFDGKLVIDSNFLTNDKNIYAAGPLTRYKKGYYCDHYDHGYFSSYEIGVEVAYRFQKRIRFEELGHEYLGKERSVTEFTSPIIVSCRIPGGWNYVHITKPGTMFPMQNKLGYQKPWGKIIQTGNAHDKDGPGYFRIIINLSEIVCDILCFTTKEVDVRNLACLYNKHESLLNKMLLRFYGGLIPDLFVYFREPWAYALYHDRFPLFMEEIQTNYLKMIEDENVSFYEAVAYSFNACKWQKVSDKDKGLLEDLFNYVPELKEQIERKLLEYIKYNENQLTTYLPPARIDRYIEAFSLSRLYDPVDLGLGEFPLVPAQPNYIVPTPSTTRKEVQDRTTERHKKEFIFKIPSDLDEHRSKFVNGKPGLKDNDNTLKSLSTLSK